MKEIDTRGLACPAPVLLVKETLDREQPDTLLVRVDNEAARENVSRFLASRGFTPQSDGAGADIVITTAAGRNVEQSHEESGSAEPRERANNRKIMVLIGSETIGAGDNELGAKLMTAFIKTLKEMGGELWRLVFINGGVKLVATGSPVLADLLAYQQRGLMILACGTCLNHYGLMAEKQCGQTTNMLDIVTAMQLADKVITFG
ncbi:MAG: sulfurtransferase-like selenium metabolism protein YedF [Desulfobulbaceae bacterium]|jgi:selenium metabolism protein YedF|nr:sulfurtransferase-like selenium metabolism protein YedF [Desulfobulbaceae bacterium]